jgi:DNA-binding beta-propeller fold protein YncE
MIALLASGEHKMTLKLEGYIDLPAHRQPGGFDHAAVHRRRGRLYVAHTSNDAIDVIDRSTDRYLYSIPNLIGVAGALVSDERDWVFTSNRGENTIGIFAPDDETNLARVPVGMHPNGLSFDPQRGLLLVANVGDPAISGSFTLSLVNVAQPAMIASIPVPGRTRWTIFDAATAAFYVNIADPAQIVIVDAKQPTQIARTFAIPAAGPHGLDLDAEKHRLFCACDAKKLITLDMASGAVLQATDLSGVPDVIFFNAALHHLYVAIGDPGVIDVFDTNTLRRSEVVVTEKGAHTIGFDTDRHKVYVFLPQTHRAAVHIDQG